MRKTVLGVVAAIFAWIFLADFIPCDSGACSDPIWVVVLSKVSFFVAVGAVIGMFYPKKKSSPTNKE